ncbi:MAG TPA: lantibiotic dehydratase [Puia sp.]|jgi:thiopeptide-type bacteriocin biosynthesis protein|nr:lantibiotic dehydratase [Puia sp.]
MNNYVIADFCFLQIPAFPKRLLDDVCDWERMGRTVFTSGIKELFGDERLMTALHSDSSPEFYTEVRRWLNSPDYLVDGKMEENLYRYLMRMTTQCGPHGLFSGFVVADLANRTNLELDETHRNTLHFRIDTETIQHIGERIRADSRIGSKVRYCLNSSCYRVDDHLKYVEYGSGLKMSRYNYSIVDVDRHLELVVQAAETGCTFEALVALLKGCSGEISEEEAVEYISQLIDSKVLVSELEPMVTIADNLARLIAILQAMEREHEWLVVLKEVRSIIDQGGYSITRADRIKSLVEIITGPKEHLSIVQTDQKVAAKGRTVNRAVFDTILKQIQDLSVFAVAIDKPALLDFKEKFVARYGIQEVPMVEALDPVIGIGYGINTGCADPLTNDIIFTQDLTPGPTTIKLDALSDLMTDKYMECARNGDIKVVLTDAELDQLRKDGMDRSLPDNFFIHGSIIARSIEDLDKGIFQFQVRHVAGPSSCLPMARFCYASEELTRGVRTCMELEASMNPEALYADIVHLPGTCDGNVVIRPHLRKYEIEYLGKSDLDTEHKIPITDIMVSIKDNQITLRSKRFNKEIIPRLAAAQLIFDSDLSIYSFLTEMQKAGGSDCLSWQWSVLQWQRFLPRVEYKNVILKTARWVISKDDLSFLKNGADQKETINALRELAAAHKLPNHVVCLESEDKEFVIDLSNNLCCKLLLRKLESDGSVVLEEYIGESDHCWVNDVNKNRYFNEVVIPVNKVISEAPINGKAAVRDSPIFIQRKMLPGSEWVYFKLFTSERGGEKVLSGGVRELVGQLQVRRKATQWHFIRHSGAECYIGIRFKTGGERRDCVEVIEEAQAVFNPLLQQQVIYSIQVDTYDREPERYGFATMDGTEEIFTTDSNACLDFINMAGNYIERHERWLWALKAIDMLMDAFGYSTEERQKLAISSEQRLKDLLRADSQTFQQINRKYSSHEKEIRAILSNNHEIASLTELTQASLSIIGGRQGDLLRVSPFILEAVGVYHEVSLEDLIGSWIQLFVNRLFGTRAEMSEFVLYSLLNRYYTTNMNRKRMAGSSGLVV